MTCTCLFNVCYLEMSSVRNGITYNLRNCTCFSYANIENREHQKLDLIYIEFFKGFVSQIIATYRAKRVKCTKIISTHVNPLVRIYTSASALSSSTTMMFIEEDILWKYLFFVPKCSSSFCRENREIEKKVLN